VAVAATSGNAEARRKQRAAYHPPYSSIVVDVNSGEVLQATNADSPRHPASLTKMMTLYLLFERLEAGTIKLSTELEVSRHAAAQAPSKLGLKPGQTITVEDAIGAIVTKSANDIAVVVAEALGGTETDFAKMMTAKARALGMRNTTYHNASGLPDDSQITTARDQAILGRALQDRFPKYYPYFSMRSFAYHGRSMRNHNHLLGRVDGVDGIKTGYIRDSGFNIAVSMRRGSRHIVAVVFGGPSARWRDARVRNLMGDTIKTAAVKRTAPLVVEGWKSNTRIAGAAPTPARDPREEMAAKVEPGATVEVAAKVENRDGPEPGSTAPIKPNLVKTVTVEPRSTQTASLSPPAPDSGKLMPAPLATGGKHVTTVATVKRERALMPAQVASAGANVPIPAAAPDAGKPHNSGYMIQVGAFDDEDQARQRLAMCKTKAKEQLGKADPYTERIGTGDKALYRARFAGLDKTQAVNACKHLKRSDIPCFTLRN
jgi:D-alanyl-D-alanine carboxypeptidase